MKKLAYSILFGVMSFAFAVTASAQKWAGPGTWQSSKGVSGAYTATMIMTYESPNKVKMTDTFSVDGNSFTVIFFLQKKDDSFYDVFSEDKRKIGSGYCFLVFGIPQQVCHSEITLNKDISVESTVRITEATVYRMGSRTTKSTGEKVIWRDELASTTKE